MSSGRSSSTFTHDISEITARWANVPSMHMPPKSRPSAWKRNVPSGRQPSRIVAPWSHRFCWPVEQKRQCPHDGMNEQTTWSPFFTRVTPTPTSSMMPAPSWPPTIGKRGTMSP